MALCRRGATARRRLSLRAIACVVAIACDLPTPFSSPCRTPARAQARSLREVHLAKERLVARVGGYVAKKRIPCHPKQPVVVLEEGAVEPSKGPVGVVARGVGQSDPKALFTGERLLSNCELPIRIAATSQRVQRKGAPSVPIDRKSTRLNSSHLGISYARFLLTKKT